ncbi:SOS response-associated peptidase [Herbaspirillum sp. NPDC101397]|uniref:SOS response-associated peptidase n=1 Tax=Herbaspirillum sp. NPDC101397 TaxID=3364006 RepID=UPI00383A7D6D
MCGRITQTRAIREYGAAVGWSEEEMRERDISGFRADYNCTPAAEHLVFRILEGVPTAEMIAWQWLSPWAKREGMRPAINAKREKLLGGYYRPLMKTGRVIVPASGWYEWTGEKGKKQPWYIRPKNGAPVFMAALTNHFPDKEDTEGAGFVIVTDDSAGGMVDIHDRRPVVLSPEDAKLWMDLDFPYEQAEQIARVSELRDDYFEWYKVSSGVNRFGKHEEDLIEPLPQEP